ncbi:uncharacterized protein LOC124899519 [Capsicum annuum]|uniref:uncharacterized protein LOC124899519 n=1 Tax=Capsicum annuum TaxID=4072 RepID=UPI001FB0A896|nr:uncharacterized protein LOC124899519 [Capsicum annuum]
MVEDERYEQFSWGKSLFQKLMSTWRQDFFVEKQLYQIGGMPYVLNVWMYEYCYEVDSTIAERMGDVISRIFNWKVVGIKVKYEKLIRGMFNKDIELNDPESAFSCDTSIDHSGKRPADDMHTRSDSELQGFKDFSIVPPPKILKKIDLSTDTSASQPTKRRRVVCFDVKTVEMQKCEKTPPSVSRGYMSTSKTPTSISDRVNAGNICPSSPSKSILQATFDVKWDETKLFIQSYESFFISGEEYDKISTCKTAKEMRDKLEVTYEGTKVKKSKIVVMVNELFKMEENENIEGDKARIIESPTFQGEQSKSADVTWKSTNTCTKTATLDALVEVVVNLKSDYANVETSIIVYIHKDHPDDYPSTIPESAQAELDTIIKYLAAPVDELFIEVVILIEETVNQHFISDSQIPPDFFDAVFAAHQAAKTPAKRTRTKSKVFKSPYLTEFAVGSKSIEDETTELKQKFTFDGFIISDDMSRGVIEE